MIAKFFIILSSLLALISNSMSLRTIGPLRVVRSSRIFTDCSLFSEDTVDCAPFFSNEESQPDEFCCSAFDYAASMDTQCICDMIGNHNSALSFNKISTLCRVTLPCDIKINSPASSPVDPPVPHDPVSPVPSTAPESESPAPTPSVPSQEPESPTSTPSVAPSPEPQSPTSTPSVAPSPESQSPTSTPSVPSPKAQPTTSPKPKRSSASLAAQSHCLLVLVLLASILFVYFY
ncbi:hypothetical protein AAZX31_14G158400 [Glycine max]|nr:hypothetical protein GLYMA_14G170200v4 [Glycine max]|eukprot:XP_006596335.1 predicted GPI-anchored protein 58 [Glycine max]